MGRPAEHEGTQFEVAGKGGRRPQDFLSLGVAYGGYSSALRSNQETNELTVELSYGLQLRPGLILQPGIQLLIHPGGNPSTPNALALGVNTVVSF